MHPVIDASNRTSHNFVKKKAALTLLRLYRKHPDVIPAAEWALRIVSIMDDQDLVKFLLYTETLKSLINQLGLCYMRH